MTKVMDVVLVVAVMASCVARGADFETQLAESVAADEVLTRAVAAKRDCSCLDEFDQRACREAAVEAEKEVRERKSLWVDVQQLAGGVQLGKYDFKKQRFSASIVGGRLVTSEVPQCPRSTESDCAFDIESSIGLPENIAAVETVGSPLWSGFVDVPEDAAREFRDQPTKLTGTLLLRADGVVVKKIENATLAGRKKAVLAEFDRRLSALIAKHGKAALSEVVEKRKCLAAAPTVDVVVTLKVKMVGIRLETESVDDYVVSMPPSATPLRDQRQAVRAEQERARSEAARRLVEEREARRQAEAKAQQQVRDNLNATYLEESMDALRDNQERCLAGDEGACYGIANSLWGLLEFKRRTSTLSEDDEKSEPLRRAVQRCATGEGQQCVAARDLFLLGSPLVPPDALLGQQFGKIACLKGVKEACPR